MTEDTVARIQHERAAQILLDVLVGLGVVAVLALLWFDRYL